MARVKICGLSEPTGIAASIEAGADWIGLVFFDRSPRAVTANQAGDLLRPVAGRIAAVGLFVDPDEDEVAAVLAQARLDALQLYAAPDRIQALQRRFGLPVWQAIGVAGAEDLPGTTIADALVVEAKPPAGSTRPGGNGIGFDWSLVSGWRAPAPWMLAGGLTVNTVAAAIDASGAGAVDVSSGVETAPGIKDPRLIRRFIEAAKRHPRQAGATGSR